MKTAEQIVTQPKNVLLMNKWGKRIGLVESVSGKMTLEKKAALAQSLENTQRLLEATQTTNIGGAEGTYKRFALDMVCAVVPNLIANEVTSVQPIENRVGMVNYIKYSYGDTKGGVQAGQEFASALNMGKSNKNYTSDVVDGEVLAIEKDTENNTFYANLDWYPVVPGSVQFTDNDGNLLVVDDGAGNLADATNPTTIVGKVNYSTGSITALTGAAETATIANYSHNNEFVPAGGHTMDANGQAYHSRAIPQIDISIESIPVVAKARKLRALFGFDASYELQKEYGTDIESLLASQASAEIAHEIDMEITGDIRHLAGANNGQEITWNRTQPVGVNIVDHYESFYAKLVEGSNKIYGATQKVRANFMVCGLNVASVVEVMKQFKPSGVTQMTGPYFLGTLGQFKVYVNPAYGDDEFVLGYKGNNLLEAGYIYAPYMPITSTKMVMFDDFAGRIGWATMYAKKMVNNKMYVKGRITDLPTVVSTDEVE